MTDQIPTRYDNYPTAAPGRAALPVAAEPPGPLDPIPPRHGRRWLFGTLLGVALGVGVGAGVVAKFSSQTEPPSVPSPLPPASESPVSSVEPTPNPSSSPVEQRVRVGTHSAAVPPGWTVERNEANDVSVTRGTNRVDAYTFFAQEGDRAADVIGPLLRRRIPGFDAKLRVVDSGAMDVGEYVEVVGRGSLGGETAKVSALLWIDGFFGGTYAEALLLMKVVTAISGSEESVQADDLSAQFAYDLPISGLG